jgi:hypothetical protein
MRTAAITTTSGKTRRSTSGGVIPRCDSLIRTIAQNPRPTTKTGAELLDSCYGAGPDSSLEGRAEEGGAVLGA